VHPIAFTVQHNGRQVNPWLRSKLSLISLEARITSRRAVAMSIRMDNDLDKIRIIEAASRLSKQRIAKLPVRRPEFP